MEGNKVMSNTFKYVMFENGTFILIPQHMNHNDVMIGGKVHSAGFVSFNEFKQNEWCESILQAWCYGESITLGKKCDKEFDEARINSSMRL